MKWCPHCRKYVETRAQKTKIQVIKWTRLVYHCLECNGFIEAEQLTNKEKELSEMGP